MGKTFNKIGLKMWKIKLPKPINRYSSNTDRFWYVCCVYVCGVCGLCICV